MTLPMHDQTADSAPRPAAPDNLVQRVVRWLRAGYPEGVPQQDYVALLGILRRTLTSTELDRVVSQLQEQAEAGISLMTPQLVEERITEVVKGPVHDDDVVRVSARLAAAGWPLGSPVSGDPDPDGSGPGGWSSNGSGVEAQAGDTGGGLVGRVVDWLRAGYPAGVPDRDFVPLLALLRRRLTDDEVQLVASRLVETGAVPSGSVDIGTAIAKVTTELPSDQDVERVRAALSEHGWPDDPA
jgi:hypothetical protein